MSACVNAPLCVLALDHDGQCQATPGLVVQPTPEVERLTPEQQDTVLANTGLIAFVLNRRRTPEDEWDDSFQDGVFGLARAVQKFDPSKGYKFSTYAVTWIKQAVARGRGISGGVNYRRTTERGDGNWIPPASLDKAIGDSGLTLADLIVALEDPADEAMQAKTLSDRLVAVLRDLCRDEFDVALLVAIADGQPLAPVARAWGYTRETAHNRFTSICGRLKDHPEARLYLDRAS